MIPISEINNKAKVEIYKDMHSIIDELKGVSSGSRFGQLAKELNSLYDLADKHKLTGYPEYEKYISRDINEQVRNSLCYELFMKDMEKYYLAVCKDLPYHYDFADQADIFDDYHFKKRL